jgi:hypothetical protein
MSAYLCELQIQSFCGIACYLPFGHFACCKVFSQDFQSKNHRTCGFSLSTFTVSASHRHELPVNAICVLSVRLSSSLEALPLLGFSSRGLVR